MKKKNFIIGIVLLVLIVIFLMVYPLIEIDRNGKIIKFGYSDDISEFEDDFCYSESYSYNKDRDISIYDFDFKKFLFFYVIILEYKEGNVCESEYVLEEEYIHNFLDNAIIEHNEKNINLDKLISGKNAIVSNTRYFGNDYETSIEYILDDKYEILYIFYVDDMLIIQVGLSDDGPKFIAYK